MRILGKERGGGKGLKSKAKREREREKKTKPDSRDFNSVFVPKHIVQYTTSVAHIPTYLPRADGYIVRSCRESRYAKQLLFSEKGVIPYLSLSLSLSRFSI